MANKLELTWYGKDEPIRVEPRLLIENTALSNTAADPDTQNMLIHKLPSWDKSRQRISSLGRIKFSHWLCSRLSS